MKQLTDWQAAGKTFVYRGHDIFYRDEGSGEVLLLIHGFPTASWDWHRIWPALTARFRVIAPDMIGFGFSAKPPDYAYTLMDQATLHEALLAELGVSAVDILAHDYGDTVAQEMLARFNSGEAPIQLRSICFLNGGLLPGEHRPRLIQHLMMTPLGPAVGRLLNERLFGRSFSAVFGPQTRPSPQEITQFWSLITHNQGQRIAHKVIRYMKEREVHKARWIGALQQSQIPLRLVNGPADPVSGRHVAQAYRRIVPSADVVLLADHIGHYPQIEDPEGVLAAFWAFHGVA